MSAWRPTAQEFYRAAVAALPVVAEGADDANDYERLASSAVFLAWCVAEAMRAAEEECIEAGDEPPFTSRGRGRSMTPDHLKKETIS